MKRFTLFALLLTASGCGIYESKTPNDSTLNSTDINAEVNALLSDPEAKISFKEINRLILKDNCLRCHNPAKPKGDVSVASFSDVRANLFEIENEVLELQEMPPRRPLSENLQRLLRRWIDEGAHE